MGLDQYWFTKVSDYEKEDFHHHREVPALEAFMANEWQQLGNKGSFNCEEVEITKDILDRLEEHCQKKTLNHEANGFFWGHHMDEDYPDILEAIGKARAYLDAGETVYYSSWW